MWGGREVHPTSAARPSCVVSLRGSSLIRVVGLKLAHLVPVMFVVSVATFFILDLVPGDAAAVIAGPGATPEAVAEIREELGLDEPLHERYVDWLGGTLTGDFGDSVLPPERPVSTVIMSVLPVTLQVALTAVFLALVVSVPAALVAAARPGTPPDRLMSSAAFAAISVPSFLFALILIFFLVFNRGIAQWSIAAVGVAASGYFAGQIRAQARRYPPGARGSYVLRRAALLAAGLAALLALAYFLPDFPRQGFSRLTSEDGILENLRSVFLPALTLAVIEAAVWMRLLRGDLLATLQEDYILAAKAKGMPRWRIMVLDALRPSSFSLITVMGVSLGRAIGGTIIVERIFNLPGMGTLMVQSINGKDIPVVQAAVLLIAIAYVLVNAFVDIMYGYLDPRIRRGHV